MSTLTRAQRMRLAMCLAGMIGSALAGMFSPVSANTTRASGPSFSCAQARVDSVEDMICRDAALSRQDRAMATAYARVRSAMRGSEGFGELLTTQQAWLRERAACVNLRTQKGLCVSETTTKRIATLDQWAAGGINPARAASRPPKTGATTGSRPPRGPSFDCTRASNSVERLICNDRSLWILDREMAGLYERASFLLAPDMAALLATEQRTFLANRNLCARRTNDKTACVLTAYEMRNLRLNEWLSNRSAD